MQSKVQKTLKKSQAYFKKNWSLYTMLIPAVAFFIVFSYIPLLGLQIAFKDYTMTGGIWGSKWAVDKLGNTDVLKYFKIIFKDKDILSKILNTLRLSSLRILFGFPVPIIIVIFMNEMRSKHYKNTIQTMLYLPHFISWVVISGILFQLTSQTSPLQKMINAVFGREIFFFNNPKTFLGLLIISDIWKEAGWATIIYLAAISNIDPAIEEAAKIDGANRFQRILHIILPGLIPAICINLIFAVSGIVYGGFDQVFNMMGENSVLYSMTDILETYIFRYGIAKQSNYTISLTTAIGMLNSTASLILILIANFLVKKLGGKGVW